MSTDDGKALVQDIAAKIRMLTQQRDDLLAALINLAETAAECDSWESFPKEPLDKAWAAITRVEEGR